MRALTLILPLALLATPALAQEPQVSVPAAPPPAPATAPVVPQVAPPSMPGMMHGQAMENRSGGRMRGGMMMNCPMMMDEHVEGRVAFLHTELKITPAQEEAWKAYADALRADAKAGAERRDQMQDQRGDVKEMDAPARMAAHISMMESKLAGMKAMQAATAGLYAVLTDEQKKTLDELAGRMR